MARPNGYPFAGGEWSSAYKLGRGPDYQAYSESLIFDPVISGGGTTHSVSAAVMAFAGQSVVSSAATVHPAGVAAMAYAGQSVASSNATVHAVTAAAAMRSMAADMASAMAIGIFEGD